MLDFLQALDVVTHEDQVVLPMPHIARAENHFRVVKSVGKAHQPLPDLQAGRSMGLGCSQSRFVSGSVKQRQVGSGADLLRVVAREQGQYLEVYPVGRILLVFIRSQERAGAGEGALGVLRHPVQHLARRLRGHFGAPRARQAARYVFFKARETGLIGGFDFDVEVQ